MENKTKSTAVRSKYVAVVEAPPPLKRIAIESDERSILSVRFAAKSKPSSVQPPLLQEAVRQMQSYLAGELKTFDLPLKLNGTKFQSSVWNALQKIPYGKLKTYTELATRIGKPKACRAVGNALGKNPLPIVIPCHRVVSRNGLGGFTGGLPVKRWLLQYEMQTPLA